jgi:hypothetical protein
MVEIHSGLVKTSKFTKINFREIIKFSKFIIFGIFEKFHIVMMWTIPMWTDSGPWWQKAGVVEQS